MAGGCQRRRARGSRGSGRLGEELKIQALGSWQAICHQGRECGRNGANVGEDLVPDGRDSLQGAGGEYVLVLLLAAGGKRRAIMDGPWEFAGDLLIVVDFDRSQRLKELQFTHSPVWIRVADLPLGFLNEEMGRTIGNKVVEFMEVETEDDGSAVGSFLRIKVRLDVRKPLARGVLVEDEEKGREMWCSFQYEFLPNFCYICGRLGHVDKDCDDYGEGSGPKQFGEWMRVNPAKKRAGSQRVGGRRVAAQEEATRKGE